jgi:alpha-tubulin suppressor-like RCC1 family protein
MIPLAAQTLKGRRSGSRFGKQVRSHPAPGQCSRGAARAAIQYRAVHDTVLLVCVLALFDAPALVAASTQPALSPSPSPSPRFGTHVLQISAGYHSTCVRVAENSGVRCFGDNSDGQLGVGEDRLQMNAPQATDVISDTSDIVLGRYTACCLMNGDVACWGNGMSFQFGDGVATNRRTPVALPQVSGVSQVAVGAAHICVLLSATSGIRCCGGNSFGQLGVGTTNDVLTFPALDAFTGVRSLPAGDYHQCAIVIEDDGVRCWGSNTAGQLGTGDFEDVTLVPPSSVLHGVKEAATAYDVTCVIMQPLDGVRCWGSGRNGQLGSGGTENAPNPPSSDLMQGVKAVAIGGKHVCVIMQLTAGLRCWGSGQDGQLGTGTTAEVLSPPTSDITSHVLQVALGYAHTCIMTGLFGIRCWGVGSRGQLGTNSTEAVLTLPVTDVTIPSHVHAPSTITQARTPTTKLTSLSSHLAPVSSRSSTSLRSSRFLEADLKVVRFGTYSSTEWSPCTKACGGGQQSRDVLCIVDGTISYDGIPCQSLPRPVSSQRCNTHPCMSAYWSVSDRWGACSQPCDDGTGLRRGMTNRSEPECMLGLAVVDTSVCNDAGLVPPPITRPCNRFPCANRMFRWIVSNVSGCVSRDGCGIGISTRTVSCEAPLNNIVADSLCALPRPSTTVRCDTGVRCACSRDGDCGQNSVCDPAGRCKCIPGWTGEDCNIVDLLAKNMTCPNGVLDAALQCCTNAVDVVTGMCCGEHDLVSRDGRCCKGWLDGCGFCNGTSSGIDSLGVCCRTPISPSGRCCDSLGGIDNCGVCGGTNNCQASVHIPVRFTDNVTSTISPAITGTWRLL